MASAQPEDHGSSGGCHGAHWPCHPPTEDGQEDLAWVKQKLAKPPSPTVALPNHSNCAAWGLEQSCPSSGHTYSSSWERWGRGGVFLCLRAEESAQVLCPTQGTENPRPLLASKVCVGSLGRGHTGPVSQEEEHCPVFFLSWAHF